jgi:hypothetical protein
MWEKVKSNLIWILTAIAGIATALLFRQSKKTAEVQSELNHEKATTEIKLNDQAREAAKQSADDLVKAYDNLKRDK